MSATSASVFSTTCWSNIVVSHWCRRRMIGTHRLAGDVAAHDDHIRLMKGAGVEELAPADLRAVNVGDVEDPERFLAHRDLLPGPLSDAPGCLEALENGLFDRARRKTVAYADYVVAVVGQLLQQASQRQRGYRENRGCDVLEEDRLPAESVLEIGGVVVDAEDPDIGDHVDTGFVGGCDHFVADVLLQHLTSHVAVDAQRHLPSAFGQQLGYAEAHPVASPVGNHDTTGGDFGASDHLAGLEQNRVVVHLDVGLAGNRAGCDDHDIGGPLTDKSGVYPDPGHDLYAGTFRFALKVCDGTTELGSTGQPFGEQHLTTDPPVRFKEGHPVASLGGDRSGLESTRAAADHHHRPWSAGRALDPVEQLAASLRMLDARDGVASMEVPDARLVASDACTDLIGRTLPGLVRHLGIADQCSGHGASVSLSCGDDEFGRLRLVDTSRDDDRDVHHVLDLGRERGGVGGWSAHGWDDVHGSTQRGGGTSRNADVIERAIAVECGACANRFVQAQPVLGHLVTRDPHSHDEVLADPRPHLRDHLAQKPETVLLVAAVFVRALVEPRVQELRRQVPVAGHDLHAIEARGLHPERRVPIPSDHLRNQDAGHRAGDGVEAVVFHCRRRVRHGQRTVLGLHDFPSWVEQLREDLAPVRMCGLGDAPIAVDRGAIGGHEHLGRVAGGFVYAADLQHDQPGPAGRAIPVIGDHLVAHEPITRHRGVVAGRDDAVLQGHRAYPQG